MNRIGTPANRMVLGLCQLDLEPFRYSGRGMFGRACIAIRASDLGLLVRLGAYFAAGGDVADDYARVSTDTMGHDVVIYWPDLPWPEPESPSDDDLRAAIGAPGFRFDRIRPGGGS